MKCLDRRASSTSAGASMIRFISNTAATVARTGAVRRAVSSFGRRRGSSTSGADRDTQVCSCRPIEPLLR